LKTEIKTLIWDFDGTLGYREGGMWGAALLEVIQQESPGLGVSMDQVRPHLQSGFPWHASDRPHPDIRSADQWWESLFPVLERALEGVGFEPARARSMAERVRPVYTAPERWRLFGDTMPTLERLSARGWAHVILSNHVPELGQIVRFLGLALHVGAIFNSAETGYEKPHPQAFQAVLDAFPGTTMMWMIGDSMGVDIAGARAVGIPAILVRRYHEDAEFYCDRLSQVPTVVV
jgi:putative hydrolase of the HAD superfamily